ncbi:single-stranded DNA-binding protein [Glutamicibacter bergerei]|uniref:Single-stranded DNA-binding protein n=1 Tax=Glutamicibacter bergerei TaxID=256702 RepID=A0ABV9MP79_9MICC|nr:single-stranded DNA-binding protein [Micrococcaceae bacterium]
MAGETVITVIGNLTGDPEMRATPSGSMVANFTIASTPRTFDRQTNEWKDGEAMFLRCSLWREQAENAVESLTKGMRVIAQGNLKMRSYDDKEGNRRTVTELEVDEIGPSLRFASAKVTRTNRSGGGNGGQNRPAPQQNQQSRPPANDPWSAGGGNTGGGWGNPDQSQAPF